jgi:hypothetical protein
MSPTLERLIELQRLATAIAESRRGIDSYPKRLQAADDLLNEATDKVDAATAALDDNKQRRLELEKEAAVFQGRLTKFQEQLSVVKTNREYQAMQIEMSSAKEELGTVEERILECMVETDSLMATLKDVQAALTTKGIEVGAEKQELAAKLTKTEHTMAEATGAHETLLKDLPATVTILFDKVSKIRKGVALSPATRDGLCSECHVRLRPAVFQEVRQNENIVQCESCQRILYYMPTQPDVTIEQAALPA